MPEGLYIQVLKCPIYSDHFLYSYVRKHIPEMSSKQSQFILPNF